MQYDFYKELGSKMQLLKFLVIFLGVLIVIGVTAIIYGLATGMGKVTDNDTKKYIDIKNIPSYQTNISIANASLEKTWSDQNYLYLVFSHLKTHVIVIIDAQSGKEIGRVSHTP